MIARFHLEPVALLALHVAIYGGSTVVVGPDLVTIYGIAFAIFLIWISIVDFRHYLIPDLAILGLIFVGVVRVWQLQISPHDALIAAAFWSLSFYIVARGFATYRGFEGLGLGDVKLVGALGLWLGMTGMIVTILAAALGGILMLLVGRATRQSGTPLDQTAIAFGPFLCLSAWAVWLQGTAG